jgi:recombination protein RecT
MVRRTQFLNPTMQEPSSLDSDTSTVNASLSLSRSGRIGEQDKTFTEKDSAYGELALKQGMTAWALNGDQQTGAVQPAIFLDWQSNTGVPLLQNIQRITAPNPSLMTGPGTNGYIVGTKETGFIVIDPGPLNPAHTQRILSACAGDIRLIVCTHSHPDHSPGARPLQKACTTQSNFTPPVLGLSSLPTARAHSQFTPDRELIDSERLTLRTETHGLEVTHTLRVVFTPGHAANHVCLVLEEDGVLFSGDHILNGSTTIVDPPDGHMGDYLSSLEKLEQICKDERVEFIMPAHGYVLGNFWGRPKSALEVVQNLHKHRLTREAKIYQTIQNDLNGSMDDWVQKAYDDVPSSIWPIAMRSLLAHVEHLKQSGRLNR